MPSKAESGQSGEQENFDAIALTELMKTAHGRRWMEKFFDHSEYRSDLYRDDGDALGMAKRDGKAALARWVEAQLEEHCPDLLLRMIRERKNRIERQRKSLENQAQQGEPSGVEFSAAASIEDQADEQKAEGAKAPEGKGKNG